MKTLAELLSNTKIIKGTPENQEVKGLVMDSRQVQEGFVFVAVKGTQVDGHKFIDDVFKKGALAVIGEEDVNCEGLYIQVENSSLALGQMASAFYDFPSREIKVVGVTGTNGKTTVATLLYELFVRLGYRVGLLSTVRNRIHDKILDSTHTTPDAVSIQSLLRRMREEGCDYCFMEVSSHAIHQNRIAGIEFTGGIFTNLTHDHLDYHGTFDNYLKAKKAFFDQLNPDAFSLSNKDDKNGMVMLQNTKSTKYTYSLGSNSDFKARILEHDFNGMLLKIDAEPEAWFRLIGRFNAYNLLAVYGAAFLLGIGRNEILQQLTQLGSVAGRFDYLRDEGITGIVDYAHTPDALKNVLEVINEVRTRNEELITVIGCGGDRDKAKRPLMAETAAKLSTKVIFTADNPRSENPEEILNEMEAGVPATDYKKTMRITDRKEAIKAAVSMAGPGDIILIAGKGHEAYQEVLGVKHPFDDKEILKEMIGKLKH